MHTQTPLTSPSLLNHLTTIKLALELLERDGPLTNKQRALVELALGAADDVVAELPRS